MRGDVGTLEQLGGIHAGSLTAIPMRPAYARRRPRARISPDSSPRSSAPRRGRRRISHDQELVARAAREPRRAPRAVQASRDRDERLVAGVVAEGLVDEREVLQGDVKILYLKLRFLTYVNASVIGLP